MKTAPANDPRSGMSRCTGGSVCAAVALLLAVHAGDARAAAVAQSKEAVAKAWRQIAALPDFWQGTWQSVGPIADDFPTPPDYTTAAVDYIKKYKPVEDSPFANCKPLGLPFVMNIGGMPMKYFQSPGMIALYIESSGMTRFIHTDGREHTPRPNPTYLGESIGHWEGDTLVVDTTGFVPDTLFQMGKLPKTALTQGDPSPLSGVIFGPHGEDLRLVERMRLVDSNTLEIQTTVHDDTVFKRPYSLPARRFIRGIERRNDPQEWACTDNRDYFDPTSGKIEYNVKDKAQNR
jgi:hypothetical protein